MGMHVYVGLEKNIEIGIAPEKWGKQCLDMGRE